MSWFIVGKIHLDEILRSRYPKSTMIQNVYGIKQFQTNLPKIARIIDQIGGHYLVVRRNKPTLVAIPFEDYQAIEQDDVLSIEMAGLAINNLVVRNETKNRVIPVSHSLSGEDVAIIKAGGKLSYVKKQC